MEIDVTPIILLISTDVEGFRYNASLIASIVRPEVLVCRDLSQLADIHTS